MLHRSDPTPLNDNILKIFESFFEKYKKTEGDCTVWSAPFRQFFPHGSFEINMTKCPRGEIFKVFVDSQKIMEIEGRENFLNSLGELEKTYPRLFKKDDFFRDMQEMVE
ncbi:MAG: hypothetical protein ACLFSY_09045 [Desulfonatronovibrionaceae bacterium]